MDNISIGHWIFAVIGSLLYVLFILWGYWREKKVYKEFDYKIFPVIFYMSIILLVLIFIS
ncbi:MAG: hypothetical protein CMP65_04790 [Flavobacteriales bacterium]|nr:hypothetical protein [Flavobacteriales bacterium]|tara:strand:- start:7710 stop:7889 length:180 start_codon:yes stop_codon:yes gene_type:complete